MKLNEVSRISILEKAVLSYKWCLDRTTVTTVSTSYTLKSNQILITTHFASLIFIHVRFWCWFEMLFGKHFPFQVGLACNKIAARIRCKYGCQVKWTFLESDRKKSTWNFNHNSLCIHHLMYFHAEQDRVWLDCIRWELIWLWKVDVKCQNGRLV